MRYIKLRVINTIAFIIMIVVNISANLIPIGIGTTAAVSNKYKNLFTPAGYTFGIWILIYILMGVFVLYQWSLLSHDEKQITNDIKRNSLLFGLTCLFNSLWMITWHYDIILLSVLLIISLLITLIVIQNRFNTKCGEDNVRKIILIGFDIYVGWIVAAVIANISAYLVSINWNGFNIANEVWMIIIVVVGMIIGSLFSLVSGKHFSTLAIVWAYIGILVNTLSLKDLSVSIPMIIGVCILIMVIVSIKSIANCCANQKASEPVNK